MKRKSVEIETLTDVAMEKPDVDKNRRNSSMTGASAEQI